MKPGFVFFGGLVLLVAIAIFALRSTNVRPPAVNTDLSATSMNVLVAALKSEGIVVKANGPAVDLGGRTLSIATSIDYVTERDGKVIVGLDFASTINGKPAPALHTGSLGIDDTRQAAIQTAMQEWALQYGVATAKALLNSDTRDGGSALSVGGIAVFPGATGIRGRAPPEFTGSDSLHRALITHVRALLEPLVVVDGPHAMTLTLVFREGAPIEGECRLDGQVSAPLFSSLQQYAWPTGSGTFMFKQYYVFTTAAPR